MAGAVNPKRRRGLVLVLPTALLSAVAGAGGWAKYGPPGQPAGIEARVAVLEEKVFQLERERDEAKNREATVRALEQQLRGLLGPQGSEDVAPRPGPGRTGPRRAPGGSP